MRTLGFDKIVGSNFEQRSVSDAGLVEARRREAPSNPCSPANNEKAPMKGAFSFAFLWLTLLSLPLETQAAVSIRTVHLP